VLIVDDVISAGTSVGESLELIAAAGAEAAGVAIALDRQERSGDDERSAVQAVESRGLHVVSIARLSDLIEWLRQDGRDASRLDAMVGYQQRYGA
jgi:orotate phosphoribosyltransferase